MALSQFYVPLNGTQVYPVEIVLFIMSLTVFASRSQRNSEITWIIPLLILWIVGVVVSDLVASSDTQSSTKGILRVVFLATNLLALLQLCDTKVKVTVAWSAVVGSMLLATVIQPDPYLIIDIWKWGLAMPTTIAVVILLGNKNIKIKSVALVLAILLTVVHFVLGYRSLAIILGATLMAAAFHSVAALRQSKKSRVLFGNSNLIRFLVTMLSLGVLLIGLYDSLSTSGALGEQARLKSQLQVADSGTSLLSGRSELPMTLSSIWDSRFIGDGSFSPPPPKSYEVGAAFYETVGFQAVGQRYEQRTYSYHSELFGMTAENGILASGFWLALIFFCLQNLGGYLKSAIKKTPLIPFLAVISIWDALFSPFGADRRMFIALSIVSIYILMKEGPENEAQSKRSYNKLQPGRLP